MDNKLITYLGINIKSRSPQFYFAALDHNAQIIALSNGNMNDALAYISGLKNAVIGINAPYNVNQGLAKENRLFRELKQENHIVNDGSLRLCELELQSKGYSPFLTPSTIKKCPSWVKAGFRLYRKCEFLGCTLLNGENPGKSFVEINTEVSFSSFTNASLLDRNTLEGRLQRQLILYEMGLEIPDPMNFYEELTRHRLLNGILPLDDIFDSGELDAIAAAFSAYLIFKNPDQAIWLGDPEEGQVVIPPGRIA